MQPRADILADAVAATDFPSGALPSPAAAGDESVIRFDRSQRRFFEDAGRVQIVCWHRQKGKDFTAAAKAVDNALATGTDWHIVSLTQRQADATFAKVLKVAKVFKLLLGQLRIIESEFQEYDASIDELFTFKSREIVLPNGARVVSLPGRDPDTLAGLTGNLILTEFGLFPNGGYDHWTVLFPLITRGTLRLIVISTPRGRNTKFYELVSSPETYSVHFCDIYQSVFEEGFVLYDQHGHPCDIDAFRALYGPTGNWEREFECKFTGDLEALIKWASIEEAAALSEGREFRYLRIDRGEGAFAGVFDVGLASGQRLEVGWDVARRGDLSVVAANLAVRGRPKHLAALCIMQDTPFAVQRNVVRTAMAGRRSVGCGDATGMGADSNETLEGEFRGRWSGVNFGGSGKRDVFSALGTAFGDGTQTIPPLDGPHKFVATDVYAAQKDDKGERPKFDVGENPLLPESHGDVAVAIGLARVAAQKHWTSPPVSRRDKPEGM